MGSWFFDFEGVEGAILLDEKVDFCGFFVAEIGKIRPQAVVVVALDKLRDHVGLEEATGVFASLEVERGFETDEVTSKPGVHNSSTLK